MTDPRCGVVKNIRPLAVAVLVATGLFGVVAFSDAPSARGGAVAYLVNATVQPGYHFANADDALTYGHGVCGKVTQGRGYAEIMGEVKPDFQTVDEFQASYLISQAVNELCPAIDLAAAQLRSPSSTTGAVTQERNETPT
jgi:hypothetical protein